MGHNHQHSHAHDHSDLLHGKSSRLFITILLNVAITVGQFFGGIISGSIALLSDALHNFSDVISLVISYIASRLSGKEASFERSYGYKRAEILAAFINSLSLIGIAIFLVVEAVERLGKPLVINSDIVIFFAIASIVLNLLSVLILHKDSKGNMNIKSAYLHLMTDVMTSVAVLIGGILMKYYEIYWFDSLLSLLIAIYLIYSTVPLLWDSVKILMQFSPKDVNLETIIEEVSQIEGVKNMHHIHIWNLNDNSVMLEAHLEMEKDCTLSEFQELLFSVEKILKYNGVNHSNIQPELNKCKDNLSPIAKEERH